MGLMWTIGNEWNYNGLYAHMSHAAATSRVAEVARIVKANDAAHPVASIYGGVPSEHTIQALGDIDIWALNIYEGLSFKSDLVTFAQRSGRPMFLGEYGADAYNAKVGREDQASQAKAAKVLTELIAGHSSVRPAASASAVSSSNSQMSGGRTKKAVNPGRTSAALRQEEGHTQTPPSMRSGGDLWTLTESRARPLRRMRLCPCRQ